MKKKNLNAKLSFTKSTVSNFNASTIKGGTAFTAQVDCDTSQIFVCLSVANCPTAGCTVNCTVTCPTNNNCPTDVSCQPSCFNAMCNITNQQGPC
ncbi:class I lanthipeptide [Kordia sp.]|uniref:class I lanthipeptide n=1 Tax=Kordia sp. TaxID=1965332 RepID=UPI003D6C4599